MAWLRHPQCGCWWNRTGPIPWPRAACALGDNRRVSDNEGSLPARHLRALRGLRRCPSGYAGRSAMGSASGSAGPPPKPCSRRSSSAPPSSCSDPWRAQGRRDEGRPADVDPRVRAARGAGWRRTAPQLTALQDSAPAMPTQTVRDIIEADLRSRLARTADEARPRCRRRRHGSARSTGRQGRRARGRGQGAVPGHRRGDEVRPEALVRMALDVGSAAVRGSTSKALSTR